jgi:Na+/H+-dicarboxylate symporter
MSIIIPAPGTIMLIIVLEAVGLDPAGLALILAVDRPLDMVRTVVTVTGDTTVASVVSASEVARPPDASPAALD